MLRFVWVILLTCLSSAQGVRYKKRGNASDETPIEVEAPRLTDPGVPSVASCNCEISYWTSHMRFPASQTGAACIGGCGGTAFQARQYGKTVKKLTLWAARRRNRGIKSIRITYNDGATQTLGSPSGGEDSNSFEFRAGEHLKGDIKLSGNGVGSRTGFIEFNTNMNRNFRYAPTGDAYKYLFPSQDSYLVGFFGRGGADIDLLGIYTFKPIRAVYYKSMRYPTLDSLALVNAPSSIASRTYCNSLSFPFPAATESVERSWSEGTKSCFSSTVGTQFGLEVKAAGGVPILGSGEVTKSWSISASITTDNCKETLRTETRSLTYPAFTVNPGSRFRYDYSQWKGVLSSLPFNAVVEFQFRDGSVFRRGESGVYSGVNYARVSESACCEETGVTRC